MPKLEVLYPPMQLRPYWGRTWVNPTYHKELGLDPGPRIEANDINAKPVYHVASEAFIFFIISLKYKINITIINMNILMFHSCSY